jgi:hypothetical protein
MQTDTRNLTPAELDAVSGAALNAFLWLKGKRHGSIGRSHRTVARPRSAPAAAHNRSEVLSRG